MAADGRAQDGSGQASQGRFLDNVLKTLNGPDAGKQAQDGPSVWRLSLDGSFYTILNVEGLHIQPVSTGKVAADIPVVVDKKGKIKTDKNGNQKMEGHWGTKDYGGLITVQSMGPTQIRGMLMEPTNGNAAYTCNSRKASVMMSFGQTTPICNFLQYSFDLVPGVTPAQAALLEMQAAIQQANSAQAQGAVGGGGNVDMSLVGTWHKQYADFSFSYSIGLVLRADGTYTKSLNGDSSGTWTSSGMMVHLSGGGSGGNRYPATDEDMSKYQRVR